MILEVDQVTSGYGRAPVLHGVTFELGERETLAILGPNGAGKTTLLLSIMGLLPLRGGCVVLDGHDVSRLAPERRAAAGLAWVPEGRRLFPSLSVRENLLVAGRGLARDQQAERLAEVIDLFSDLARLLERPAWALSGGQQQMVAVGRALIARPRVLLLDEPSLGLAPIIVRMLMGALDEVGERGQAMILVEQNVTAGLRLADRAMVLSKGSVAYLGDPETLLADGSMRSAYLTESA